MEHSQIQKLSIAGIQIDTINLTNLLDILHEAASTGNRALILYQNLHSLYIYQTYAPFKAFYSMASWVYIDGMPVVWIGRAAGFPLRREHRITFLDCFDVLLSKAAESSWRVFYLGSSPDANAQGLILLRKRHPDLTIHGHHGFFAKTGSETEEVVAKINEFQPHILFVGMGMPIQEDWLSTNLSRIEASAILTCGSTLDYVTGHAFQPPAWAGPLGLYGAFRLFSDPKRLWRRYLIEPFVLMRYLLPSLLRQRLGASRSRGNPTI